MLSPRLVGFGFLHAAGLLAGLIFLWLGRSIALAVVGLAIGSMSAFPLLQAINAKSNRNEQQRAFAGHCLGAAIGAALATALSAAHFGVGGRTLLVGAFAVLFAASFFWLRSKGTPMGKPI